MPTYAAIAAPIRLRFESLITTALAVPTQFDNAPELALSGAEALWCSWAVIMGPAKQVEFGAGARYRLEGQAVAEVHGPVGKGSGPLWPVVDAIDVAFKSAIVSPGIHFLTPRVDVLGARSTADRTWWRVDVTCPFRVDTVT